MVLTRPRRALALAGAAVLWAAACGTGVTPGTTGAEPVFNFGAHLASADAIPATARPTLGVIWTDPLQQQPDLLMPPDRISSNLGRDTFGSFLGSFYRPPPPAAMVRIDSPDGRDWIEIALGEAVIFDDVDQNGAFAIGDPHAEIAFPDRYLAASGQAIVYVGRPFSSVQPGFPLGATLLPGYTTVDFDCDVQMPHDIRQDVGMLFVPQPSQRLPEIRPCRRSHSP